MSEDQAVHPEAALYGHEWSWREPIHGEHFRRCSYCGSVHPADLAAETGWHANWADRKYGWPHKFYVDIPNREPDALFVVSSTFGGPPDRPTEPGHIAWEDLTDEQVTLYVRDHGPVTDQRPPPRSVRFGRRPDHFGKFYSIHLSDPAISAEVKDSIERRSGLVFTFVDGRVGWCGYPYEEHTCAP